MADLGKIEVAVTGITGLMDNIFSRLRQELCGAIRAVASKETDGRVIARLTEIGAMLEGALAEGQAREAVATAKPSSERRRERLDAGVSAPLPVGEQR